jgi:hypothetical protein
MTQCERGGEGITICPKRAWLTTAWSGGGCSHKKAPAMTLAQAKRLLMAVLRHKPWRLEDAIAMVHYQQERNDAAYCSHRKRTRQRYQHRGFTESMWAKVSL